MPMVAERTVRTDADGAPIVSYIEGCLRGRLWADRITMHQPDAAGFILREMSGWAITCPTESADSLFTGGFVVSRSASRMSRDLRADAPPSEWANLSPPPPLQLVDCDNDMAFAKRLLPAWRAAYTAGHPDHLSENDATILREHLVPLLAGTTYGRLLPYSAVILDVRGEVVAGAIVNLVPGHIPWSGPWLTELFRSPDASYVGLGGLLLRRVLARAAADDLPVLGLVVARNNPARRVYERHGFQLLDNFSTFIVP